MLLRAAHTTRYLYQSPVSVCQTQAHLTPRTRANQTVLEHDLVVNPPPVFSASHEDYFGNDVTTFSIEQPHQELSITARSLVEVSPSSPPQLGLSPSWNQVSTEVHQRATADAFEASQFVFESPLIRTGDVFASYAATSFVEGRPLLEAAEDLSHRIFTEFRYDPRATTVTTPVDEVLACRHGVCQDFAQLMIACLRSLNLPARYVSGYVRSGGSFVGAEASHAWVSVWCPVFGWQDFDPTNNLMPQGEHVTLAWGRDYSDVAPVNGVALGGGEQVISVSVDVSPAPAQ